MAGCGSDEKKSGPECGNGKIDTLADGAAAEECDGTELGGATCANATMRPGSTGTLTCSATCTLVTTACSMPSTGGAGGTGGTVVMGGMGGMMMGGMGGMMASGGTGGSSTGGSSTGGTTTTDGGNDASLDASADATDAGNGRGQP